MDLIYESLPGMAWINKEGRVHTTRSAGQIEARSQHHHIDSDELEYSHIVHHFGEPTITGARETDMLWAIDTPDGAAILYGVEHDELHDTDEDATKLCWILQAINPEAYNWVHDVLEAF